MKGLPSDSGGPDCDAKMSADFMADPGAKKKMDKRVTLHYEDGRMVLGGGEEGVAERDDSDEGRSDGEGEGSEGEDEGSEEEEGIEGGELEEEDGEGEDEDESEEEEEDGSEEEIGYGSDLDISEGEDEMEKKEKNMEEEDKISLMRQQACEELPYTFTGLCLCASCLVMSFVLFFLSSQNPC